MIRIVLAAVAYFACVFVVAFALGVVRTLWLAPALGETWAVACEIPVLLAVMWLSVKHVVPRFNPPRHVAALLLVGGLALLLQQAAEMVLIRLAGETLAQQLAYLQTPAGMIYLGALAVYLVLPALLLRERG